MRRHHRSLEINSELNLTNMLDTAFTLLIAFMLVAPMIKHGIDLRMPQVRSGQIATSTNTTTIVIAGAPEEGFEEPIYIEDQRVTLADLEGLLAERQMSFDNMSVVVEADKSVTWNTVAQVLGTAKRLGITSIGLVFEPTTPDAATKTAATPAA